MLTHAALLPTPDVRVVRKLGPGMPVPRCGSNDDENNTAIAWERRYVDCPMCIYEMDHTPVIPGRVTMPRELPLRTPHKPDYVPEGAHYHPMEFVGEHPRGRRSLNLLQALAVWVLVVAAVVTVIMLVSKWNGDAQPDFTPAPTSTVTPHPITRPAWTK